MGLKECCADRSNREQIYEMLVDDQGRGPDEATLIEVCKVCGCRHYTISADPGKFGIELSPLGGLNDGSL